MDSQKSDELYEKFPHLYRERTAPLESSKMAWGFQCEDGWYKIIYEMSKKIQKISNDSDYAPAITQISRKEDGVLYVEARNLSPGIADIITAAQEQSRLTCEYCSYSPAFLREETPSRLRGHIVCARCVSKIEGGARRKTSEGGSKPLRPPDTIIIKR